MPRFWRGSLAAVVGRSGVRGGGALASTAAAAPSFLGGYLVSQASILRATYFLQGLVVSSTSSSFSMAQASLYKQSSLASTMGSWVFLKGDTLRKLGKLGQSNSPVAGPRLATGPRPATGVMLCPSAPGESADASMDDTVMDFMLCRGILREHVGLEVGDEGLEVGEHPLGRCPSTYAAHANKIVSEPYQEEQCSKMQCQRSKHWIASDLTLLNCQTRRTKAKLESMILWINAVDSENQPACPPIIASVELTKPTWHVLWLENLKQDESMKHQCDRNLHILTEMSVDLNHKKFLHSILRLLAIWWSEVKLQWSRGSLGSLRQKIDLVNQAQGELTHFESDSCSGKKNGSSRAQLKLFWENQLINGKNTFFKT
jgi:hypothetical protein